jgi:predicted DCC family thiol-disulfide oxidoreductase YuxK
VLALPSQTPGVPERTGLSRADLSRAAWAIDRRGRGYAGAAALNRVLVELPPPWRWLAGLYRLPLAGAIEDAGYRWFAANRARFGRWGVMPACARPGVPCDPPGR